MRSLYVNLSLLLFPWASLLASNRAQYRDRNATWILSVLDFCVSSGAREHGKSIMLMDQDFQNWTWLRLSTAQRRSAALLRLSVGAHASCRGRLSIFAALYCAAAEAAALRRCAVLRRHAVLVRCAAALRCCVACAASLR